MNKIITILTISLALLWGNNAYATDIQNGLLSYKWGDNPSQHSGLSKLGTKNDVSYYSKPGETYTVGKTSIDKVIYGFYKDQLFGVYLNLNSIEIHNKLLDHLKSQYGLPTYKSTDTNWGIYKWKQQDVTIKLKMNTTAGTMKLAFYYRPLSNQLNPQQWEDLDTSGFNFVPIEKDKKPEKFVLFTF